jgi:hypothetical protein
MTQESQVTQVAQVAQSVEVKTRVMSPAAKAALEASRARYDLAEAVLTILESDVLGGFMLDEDFTELTNRASEHLAAEKKRKAEEAEYRRLNNQRGVGLALHREKTNAALNLMETLKAAGLSPEDIMSGKINPAEIAKILAAKPQEPGEVPPEAAATQAE